PFGDAREFGEHAAQAPNFGCDRRGAALFELLIKLVQAGAGGLGRVEGVVAAQVRVAYLRDARVVEPVCVRRALDRAARWSASASLRRGVPERRERRADDERKERGWKFPSHQAKHPWKCAD